MENINNSDQFRLREYDESDNTTLKKFFYELFAFLTKIDDLGIRKSLTKTESNYIFSCSLNNVRNREGKIFIAENNLNKIVGFVVVFLKPRNRNKIKKELNGKVGVIANLFVCDKEKGKGISKLLINKAEEYFKSKNCTYVRVSAFAPNQVARNLYSKLGYKEKHISYLKKIRGSKTKREK